MSDVISNDEKYKRCVEDIGDLLQKTVRIFQMFVGFRIAYLLPFSSQQISRETLALQRIGVYRLR